MEILTEILIKFLVYIGAAAVIGGVLRLIFGKSLLVSIYFWLIPGVMLTIIAAFISGRAVDLNLPWAKLTTPFGVLILTGNFIIMGKLLMGRLQLMSDELNAVAAEMESSALSVVASAQSLADNASTQAAAIEETASSLEEMSARTKGNAEHSYEAKALTSKAKAVVDKVNGQMADMSMAVQEATQTSVEISRIIKTIDEIAFQTNLLALNAAVEAARAGEAGAGFAVVAGEVRMLAQRSAEAARNTTELIENTIAVVKRNSDLTKQTRMSFDENVEIVGKIDSLVDEITAASRVQAEGIEEINRAVAEMDRITQQNAAAAEESAGASQEMENYVFNARKVVRDLNFYIQGMQTNDEKETDQASIRASLPTPAASPVKRLPGH